MYLNKNDSLSKQGGPVGVLPTLTVWIFQKLRKNILVNPSSKGTWFESPRSKIFKSCSMHFQYIERAFASGVVYKICLISNRTVCIYELGVVFQEQNECKLVNVNIILVTDHV